MQISGYNTTMRNGNVHERSLIFFMIVMMVLIISLGGCSTQGERLMSLASFKQIQASARGPVFMKMVRAYYQNTKAPRDDVIPEHQEDDEFDPFIQPIRDEEYTAMIALYRIQSVDLSQEVPTDQILQTMSAQEVWQRLTERSRLAYRLVYHDDGAG